MAEPEMSLVSSTISSSIVDIRDRSAPPEPPVAWAEGREGAAKQTFTIFARIMHRGQAISPLVRQALQGRLKHSARQVFDAIVESGGRLGQVVVSLLDERWDPVLANELLALCDEAHYRESVPMMEIALAATRQVFELRKIWKSDGTRSLTITTGEGLPPLTGELLNKAELARVANNLGARLLFAHRDKEAREALGMALIFRRELADVRPDLYAARLADTQLNLANLDTPQEALSRIEEAIEIYHRLGANGVPGLVRSWTQASDVLRRMGRSQDALTAACQASICYQNLAIQGFEALSLRAEVLVALGASLGVCGHLAEALVAYEQAVALLRELNNLRSDQIRPRLARSLLGQSSAALALRQGNQALDLAREAIALQRKLVEERPDLYLPELVRSLNRLRDLLGVLGHNDEAVSVREEAERIADSVQYSDLASENR